MQMDKIWRGRHIFQMNRQAVCRAAGRANKHLTYDEAVNMRTHCTATHKAMTKGVAITEGTELASTQAVAEHHRTSQVEHHRQDHIEHNKTSQAEHHKIENITGGPSHTEHHRENITQAEHRKSITQRTSQVKHHIHSITAQGEHHRENITRASHREHHIQNITGRT